jgi:hypothetical protein
MMPVPPAARFTAVEVPPTEGTLRGMPVSAINLTWKETALDPVLVKYKAEYHPPPNANWGRTLDAATSPVNTGHTK